MPPAQGPQAAKRPSRWLDRTIGILLGLALGLAVIVVFVFEGSEQTIDAPRISGTEDVQPQPGLPFEERRLPLVRIVGGRPPSGGPVLVRFAVGRRAQFFVDSDQPLAIQILGYGVVRDVKAGRTLVSFAARKRGQYPVLVAATKIEVARLEVTR